MQLPDLTPRELNPTRNYLQDAAKIIGKLQQAFLPPSPHDWQRGLEVTLRGLTTQTFELNGRPQRALIDLVTHKLRLGSEYWRFRENPPGQLLAEVRQWLVRQGSDAELAEPELSEGLVEYDHAQAAAYAEALWWMDEQFRRFKTGLSAGAASPILLYPHHFDLSLVWFPWDDERQIGLGCSTGDATISEPYLYITAHPEPPGFKKLTLPPPAYWQSDGFSGAVLPYRRLAASQNPEKLFRQFAEPLFAQARELF